MSELLRLLRAELGEDGVRVGDEIPPRNWADWSGMEAVRPLALILPRNVEQVSAALRLLSAHGQKVALQGGLTGLAGGGTPAGDEVALSLERLVGVEEVDTAAATMTVLAGTPLEQAQRAAEEAGFGLGLDLGARGSCSVGGNVATNAGGVQVLRYGMTRSSVRGLEVVLADGTVVTGLNKMLKNNAGYDWTQLFIGSEGTLGVVTRVVLALQPQPRDLATAYCSARDFDAAVRALRTLQGALGGGLLAFEAMWPDFIDYGRRVCGVEPALPATTDLALIVEASGAGERFEAALMQLIEDGVLGDAVIAQSVAERRRIWALRETPADFPSRMPGLVAFDVSIPLKVMAEAVDALRGELHSRWPGITALFYGHVADSNLHLICHVPNEPRQPKGEINDLVYGVVARHGGSISAEHGVGRLKKPYLALSRTPEELDLMRRIKSALDPAGILNPGRVFD